MAQTWTTKGVLHKFWPKVEWEYFSYCSSGISQHFKCHLSEGQVAGSLVDM